MEVFSRPNEHIVDHQVLIEITYHKQHQMKLTFKGSLSGFLIIVSLLTSSLAVAQRTITLEEFRQLSIHQNNNLKAADQNILVAEAQKKQADANGKFTLDGSVTGFYF